MICFLFGVWYESQGGSGEISFGLAAISWVYFVVLIKVIVIIEVVLVKIVVGISTLETCIDLDINCSKSDWEVISNEGDNKLGKDIGDHELLSKPCLGLSKIDREDRDEWTNWMDIEGVTVTIGMTS